MKKQRVVEDIYSRIVLFFPSVYRKILLIVVFLIKRSIFLHFFFEGFSKHSMSYPTQYYFI